MHGLRRSTWTWTWTCASALVAVAVASCSSSAGLPDETLPPFSGGTITFPSTTTSTPGVSETTSTAVAPTDATSTTSTTSTTTTTTTSPQVVWQGWRYYDVPQLGSESVRGTGCGSDGSLGEVIPDGVWNVIIGDGSGADAFWTTSQIRVDVRCIYTGAAGRQLYTTACATDPEGDACAVGSPDWYVVNANSRLRTMPVAPNVQYGVGGLASTPCAPITLDHSSPDAPWRFMDSWIVIDHGAVTTVIAACPAG